MARRTKLAVAAMAAALVASMGAAGMAATSDAAPAPHFAKRGDAAAAADPLDQRKSAPSAFVALIARTRLDP